MKDSRSLVVVITEAKELKAKEVNGTSDPFVKISWAGTTHKTEVIKKTLNPVWSSGNRFLFTGDDVKNPYLSNHVKFEVYHFDRFSKNIFIGEAVVALDSIEANAGPKNHWLDIGGHGKLHVSIEISDKNAPKVDKDALRHRSGVSTLTEKIHVDASSSTVRPRLGEDNRSSQQNIPTFNVQSSKIASPTTPKANVSPQSVSYAGSQSSLRPHAKINDSIVSQRRESAQSMKEEHISSPISKELVFSPTVLTPKKSSAQSIVASVSAKVDQSSNDARKRNIKENYRYDDDGFFIDDEFPCEERSLYRAGTGVSDKELTEVPPGAANITNWLRPHEISGVKDPKLFIDGSNQGDVNQGQLGNCWFISALCVLGGHEEVLRYCVASTPEMHKKGLYTIRYFKEGDWFYVDIDDRIPCDQYKRPVFGHCTDPNELWVPLIEKSYAKLFGCYGALTGGHTRDALVDLTGGISSDINLKEVKDKDQLWQKLIKYVNDKEGGYHLVGVSSSRPKDELERVGLLHGHAYAILKCINLRGNRLLEMKNPWAHGEWKGPWSDNSAEWNDALLRELNSHYGKEDRFEFKDDGCFFMDFEDFCNYWTQIDIVRVFDGYAAEMNKKSEWQCNTIIGEWNKGSWGGCFSKNTLVSHLNPQYLLEVPVDTEAIFSLSQYDYRYLDDDKTEYHSIGFHVMKEGHRLVGFELDQMLYKSDYMPTREVSIIDEVSLPAGKYTIVCSTFHPFNKSKFLLRVFTRAKCKLTPMPAFEDVYKTISVGGKWEGESAGGCQNTWKWINNPQYRLLIPDCNITTSLTISLEQVPRNPNDTLKSIGLFILKNNKDDPNMPVISYDRIIDTGAFTNKRQVMFKIDCQKYKNEKNQFDCVLVPCTFREGEASKYVLAAYWEKGEIDLHSMKAFCVKDIQGQWINKINAGGCPNNILSFLSNPRFKLKVSMSPSLIQARVSIAIIQPNTTQYRGVGLHIFINNNEDQIHYKTPSWTAGRIVPINSVELKPGVEYTMMPSTFEAGEEGEFIIREIHDARIKERRYSVRKTYNEDQIYKSGALSFYDTL